MLDTRFGSGADAFPWGLFPSFRPPVAGKSQGQETSRCLIRSNSSTQLYSAELRLAGEPGRGAAFLRSLAAAQTLLVLPLVARPPPASAVRRGNLNGGDGNQATF